MEHQAVSMRSQFFSYAISRAVQSIVCPFGGVTESIGLQD